MPTKINAHQGPQAKFFSLQARQRSRSRFQRPFLAQAPWLGWMPDVPASLVEFAGARDLNGLVALPYRGRGVYLRHDDGFTKIDPTNLPLNTGGAIVGLGQYRQTGSVIQRVAISAGGAQTRLYHRPGGVWTEVSKNAAIVGAWATDRETLYDSATYSAGAPTRTPAITQQIRVMCGGDDIAPRGQVLVTPDDIGVGSYDYLARGSSLDPFSAQSVCAFDDRLCFLNVIEAGTHYEWRFRWTAVGTGFPEIGSGHVGSGFVNLRQHSRPGLRCEPLGNSVACYFGDGVDLMRPTGLKTDAFRPQSLTDRRGLLSTHSMVPLTPNLHFGIFNDGWWFLDSSGRWKEAGVLFLEETRGKTAEYSKWRKTWYELLDVNRRHLISVGFNFFDKLINILTPVNGGGFRVFKYHIDTDSCWPDENFVPSFFGQEDVDIFTGETWDTLSTAGTTWNDLDGVSWDSLQPRSGLEGVVFGDASGNLYLRDANTHLYDGTAPSYRYQPHDQLIDPEDPFREGTIHRAGVGYLNLAGLDMTMTHVVEGRMEGSAAIGLNETGDAINQKHTASAIFRTLGSHHTLQLAGTAPVAIEQIAGNMMSYGSLDMEGQS